MKIKINSETKYYTNKTPLLIKETIYPIGIIFEFKKNKYYPIYHYKQGKLLKSNLKGLYQLDNFPITETIIFQSKDIESCIKIKGKENSFIDILEAPNQIYLNKNFFFEWFSLIYPLYIMQEISYYLFENSICEIAYDLIYKYEKLFTKDSDKYNKEIVIQLSKYLFNLLIMIQKIEYEETIKEPYNLSNINRINEKTLSKIDYIEELKIRNSLLLEFLKK